MVLPLGFCRLKDRCYIKTARMCNIRKKGFEDDSSTLCSVCWFSCFFLIFPFFFLSFFFFLHVPPPHYWCWLAVSRSNNIAEWFSKNTVAAVRLFRGVTLEEADSPRHRHRWGFARTQTGPLTDTSCGAGVSSLSGRWGKQSRTHRNREDEHLPCVERSPQTVTANSSRNKHKHAFERMSRTALWVRIFKMIWFQKFLESSYFTPFVTMHQKSIIHCSNCPVLGGHLLPVGLCGYRWILSRRLLWQREFLQRHWTLIAAHTEGQSRLLISPLQYNYIHWCDLWPYCKVKRKHFLLRPFMELV